MPTRRELANAIRFLSMDAVQKANSGHPGMPMGMADIAEVLWNDFLRHSPKNPHWDNRDRFILSNGHGSMLQYALLHLSGYDLTIDDIKQFRQLHSRTPGHPEYGMTPGVETTTGPLGQGLANGVGMALAERTLAAEFNQPGFPIVDHYTYVFCGDGCLMEGISHEVCSLAGTLQLGKLILFWDDNGISIDGEVAGWFTDDTPARFRAYGWHVIANIDGHNPDSIKNAIALAQKETTRPTIICCRTQIAYGAPNLAGTAKAHGAALGEAEIAATRKLLNWSYPPFVIPDTIYAAWNAQEKGQSIENQWQDMFQRYQQAYPELAREYLRRLNKELPTTFATGVSQYISQLQNAPQNVATRKSSQNCLNVLGPLMPELLSGSADLTDSTLTRFNGSITIDAKQHVGNCLYYGVREFGMSAIMNGLALHGGFIPYGGTFLTFTDYARNAVRMSALMKQRVIYVYTHDSIGLGEDGPTHQPIEHASMLRLTPNLLVWRPADAIETAITWQQAILKMDAPSALLLSRQNLPALPHSPESIALIERGGYILQDCNGTPDIIMIATGSEVQLALGAATQLKQKNIRVRVVSMPCTQQFDHQSTEYRETVLPNQVAARIAIEAGSSAYWHKYVGLKGKVIGLDRFGESAPAEAVFHALGFTVEHVVASALELYESVHVA